MTGIRWACALAAAVLVAGESGVLADMLILRDGRRIEGVLTAVRTDGLMFEHRSGRDRGKILRYDREAVRAVEFETDSVGNRYRDDDERSDTPRRRTGMRERSISIDARTAWTDAGIDVRPGQELLFEATGQVRWGPNRRNGAAGERSSPFNQARPMPDRNAAALIGRIGPNGDPFFIGDDREPIRVRGGGRLFLGLNDDFLGDNSGALRVVVSY